MKKNSGSFSRTLGWACVKHFEGDVFHSGGPQSIQDRHNVTIPREPVDH
jgi:hypothetical protein